MSFRETEIGSIPVDWDIVKLGDLIDILSGYAFKSKDFECGGVPVIKIKNIVPPNISIEDAQCVNEKFYFENEKYRLKYNDILISMTGSNYNQMASAVGKVGKIRIKDAKMLINQRVGKIIPDESKCDKEYIYQYISTFETQYRLASSAGGSANQANISPKQIKDLVIPYPPLNEQKAIAHILSTLDEKIEVNNQINKTLEKMAQAIFKQWFVDFEFPNEAGEPYQSSGGEMVESELGLVPKGWEVGTLGDILTLNYGKSLPAKKRLEGNVKVYSSAGVTGLHNEALIHEPSIIVGRKGTIGTVYYSTEPSFCIDTAYFATQKDSKYPLILMYQLLKEIDLKQYNEDSAVPGLNRNTVYAIKIVIPPVELQNTIGVQILAIYNLIFQNIKQNEKLSAIRDLLLPKLMAGEIRVPIEDINNEIS
ncbi:restriction endonuclease subunit S [Acetobacterium woodii]|uniref:Type I restriction-modification system specificity subunit HsdS2 n=1 Tax=Acetobacterium woodii (strain ATCC 29683 / DSM 1030 / JCM 2381 / KCTC 1655 / WB1) TaxID=931626 RepID=H6LBS9_ACEWD|nr:restriction endonuclease subunit S [Acetobacterium woodii]AFA47672.1 type I restriction-modification system specificity subunit HsdS2 [Acetobacterium woodii DSM 1030]